MTEVHFFQQQQQQQQQQGKLKRGVDDNDENICLSMSDNYSLSPRTQPFGIQTLKKTRRSVDAMDDSWDQNIGENTVDPLMMKKQRSTQEPPSTNFATNSQKSVEALYYEGLNRSLQDLNSRTSHEVSQLQARLREMENANRALNEENKIFKRAVAIQDSKLKEAASQGEEMNRMLQQAVEVIAQLEKNNLALRDALFRQSCQNVAMDDFMPQPPPDVF